MRSNKTARTVPAARSDGLLVQTLGDETVIYDTESKEAHCLKPLAAVVFDCSDGNATVGAIARAAEERLGCDVSEADIVVAVGQLESAGLLQTALVVRAGGALVATNGNGVSRREMLRRVGLAGAGTAMGTSLITSIVPPAALAASSIPVGCPGCTTNSNCTGANGNPGTGHCCQANPGKGCNNSCCVLQNNSCHVRSGQCVGGPTPGISCSFDSTCGSGGTCNGQCTSCNPTALNPCPTTCPGGQAPCCDNLGTNGCLAGVDDPPPPPPPPPL